MDVATGKHGSLPPLASRAVTSYFLLLFFVTLTLFVNYLLYMQVQSFFMQQLQKRIVSIASTASLQFDSNQLVNIQGTDSIDTSAYRNVVFQLQAIRATNEDIKFAYILRKTEDPNKFTFVADADSLDPNLKIDLNNDGIIDDSDALNSPGDEYDVSEFPWLRDYAFTRSTVDPELSVDQWGTFLSASAPIFSRKGVSNEMIGIDVEVSDFVKITNAALIPFALVVAFLLLLFTAQTVSLVNTWGARVKLLRDLDRQKDELLSIVSHQLATPVASVKWYLEMLLDGDVGVLSKEQQEYLNTMQSVTYNLADLVSMILDVSRIQLGKMKVDLQPLNLNSFFKEILTVIQPKAKEKNQSFQVTIPDNLPTALLDRRLTHMTVENLLSNAVKYTPINGSVTWRIEQRGDVLYMEVKDTGCGIPEKDQKNIFGKLYRASNTGSIDGNGFGLYVAKGAIEAQGGKIWFESKENKGTTFFVEMPIKKPVSEASVPAR